MDEPQQTDRATRNFQNVLDDLARVKAQKADAERDWWDEKRKVGRLEEALRKFDCPECEGTGKVYDETIFPKRAKCSYCGGVGLHPVAIAALKANSISEVTAELPRHSKSENLTTNERGEIVPEDPSKSARFEWLEASGCTCERGANLDHWSRCEVHGLKRGQ